MGNRTLIDLDYAALRATPVNPDPYPHVVVPGFVPASALAEVAADLPPIDKGGSFPPSALRLGPRAQDLVAALESKAMREAVAARFDLALDDAPTMLTVRGWTREKDGRVHRDSNAKLVTVLLYLNQDNAAFEGNAGRLRLLRGPDDVENFAVEVPPVNGTLLVFPNGPSTWHGHKPFVGPRYSMQLNYMTTDRMARSELRRHRVSALVKRWTRAA